MVWSLQTSPELSDQQFEQWRKLLEERTGIQLAPQQRAFLQTQISMRMREMGYSDYGEYFQQVVDGVQGMVEWTTLVDRLVVKETSFFRHRQSIEYVSRLLQSHINNHRLNDSFDIWSVGCATGEEPYSLAMTVNDCFDLASIDPYFGITATDISMPALAFARKGIYHARKLDQIRPAEKTRYFEQVDSGYQIDGSLRDRVCFTRGNILNINDMPSVKMNVIFCQNVLIYFRRWRRREILNAFVDRLKPGGVLIIGLGEIVEWEHPETKRLSDDQIQAYVRC